MRPEDLVLTARGVRFRGHLFPCSIGRGGVSRNKREGDGATPAGSHRITGVFYRADRLPPPTGCARPIGPGDLWSDDIADPHYNLLVRAPHGFGHETLRRADPLYDIVLLTDWNWPDAVPGRGSAIFLHQWRRPGYPTEGCLAFSRQNLLWITKHLSPRSRVIVRSRDQRPDPGQSRR